MSDFSKISIDAVYSESSNYADPQTQTNFPSREDSTVTKQKHLKVSAAVAGTTVDLSEFTTINQLIVKNRDNTNYVTAVYRTAGGAATDQTIRIGAGKFLVLSDVTVANDIALTANTAACVCELYVDGL